MPVTRFFLAGSRASGACTCSAPERVSFFIRCYARSFAVPHPHALSDIAETGDAVATCFPRSSYEFHSVARRRLGTLCMLCFRSDLLLMPSGSLTFQNEKKADAFCPCIFMFGVLGHGAYAGCEIYFYVCYLFAAFQLKHRSTQRGS